MKREQALDSEQQSKMITQEESYQKLIQQTCPAHEGNKLDYLCIDSTQSFVFKCMFCVTDEDVKQYSLIPIQQILTANQKTVFANFPLSDRALTREVKQLSLRPPTGEALKLDIDKYFKDLRANILEKLETIQAKMVEKAHSISDLSGEIMTLYDSMSEKTQLQSILVDVNKPFEDKTAELKALCERVMSKDSENQLKIRAALNKVSILQKAIDFDSPRQIKDSVLKQLDCIDLFLVEDMKTLSEQLRDQNQARSEPNQAVVDLMKLVRNKFNEVSVESSAKFEEQLHRMKFIISSMNIPTPGPTYAKLESLNENQVKAISSLIDKLAVNIGTDSESEQIINGENQQVNVEKESIDPDQIVGILRNQMNFCSTEFVDNVSEVFTSLRDILALFKVRKTHPQKQDELSMNGLKPCQVSNLIKLACTMNQLNLMHEDRYILSRKPQENIQNNSVLARAKLRNYNRNELVIDQLLVDYPIFELLPNTDIINQLLPINFIKTKFGSSQEMVISQNEGCVKLMLSSEKEGQSVSDIFDNERAYSLKLKFNRPYGLAKSGLFCIGLIPNAKIDSNCVLQFDRNNAGLLTKTTKGAKILTKGRRLSDKELMNVISELEFRWCVKNRQFFISDSTYSNINQVEENFFDPNEKYRFGVYFEKLAEDDWSVTISDFKEISVDSITQFL